ncbi:hypothetical protein [Flammeovirga sp. SubArs3]|uniref:hypothetical protein n=1 Tax=Flammeovirga sp. SubArs3 TaxID=2995316 RepID=UPI00248CE29B|nr:hypothetical protein [Flammeovirga sp. SubArs3]
MSNTFRNMYNFANNYTRWKGVVAGGKEAIGQLVSSGDPNLDLYDIGAEVVGGYTKKGWQGFLLGASGWALDYKVSDAKNFELLPSFGEPLDITVDTFLGVHEQGITTLTGHFLEKSVVNSKYVSKLMLHFHDILMNSGYKYLGEKMKDKGW